MIGRTGYLAALGVALAAILSASPALAICKLGVMADLPVTMTGLRASVPVKVEGRDTSFWLDSGAFFSIMSRAKAIELGLSIKPAPQGLYVIGIGGKASVEMVTIKSFGIVGQQLPNIQFLVGGSDAGNGLIGRNLLGLADTEFDLANGVVKLIRPSDCEKSGLAYWAAGKPYFTVPLLTGSNPFDHIFRLPVTINGVRIEAELDSGRPHRCSAVVRRSARASTSRHRGLSHPMASRVSAVGRKRDGSCRSPAWASGMRKSCAPGSK